MPPTAEYLHRRTSVEAHVKILAAGAADLEIDAVGNTQIQLQPRRPRWRPVRDSMVTDRRGGASPDVHHAAVDENDNKRRRNAGFRTMAS